MPNKLPRIVFEFAMELKKKQRKSGFWGDDSHSLNSSILTTQAVIFFNSFRCKYFDNEISQACKAMTRNDFLSSEFGYWALLPILMSSGVSQIDKDHAWRKVKEKVKSELKHHPQTPLRPFYVYCTDLLGKKDELCDSLADGFLLELEDIPNEFSAACVTFRLLSLWRHKVEIEQDVWNNVIARLEVLRENASHGVCWGGKIDTTAYVVMNLIELYNLNAFEKNSKLYKMIVDGEQYLSNLFILENFTADLNAGGGSEIDRELFNKIVASRAMAQYFDLDTRGWQQQFWSQEFCYAISKYKKSLCLVVLLLIIVCVFSFRHIDFDIFNGVWARFKAKFSEDIGVVASLVTIGMAIPVFKCCNFLWNRYVK